VNASDFFDFTLVSLPQIGAVGERPASNTGYAVTNGHGGQAGTAIERQVLDAGDAVVVQRDRRQRNGGRPRQRLTGRSEIAPIAGTRLSSCALESG
jgi:hypothetical protein